MNALHEYSRLLLMQLEDAFKLEEPSLQHAAKLCADAASEKRIIHIYDTGHLISHELVARVGGLVNFTHFGFSAQVQSENPYRERHRQPDAFLSQQKLTEWALLQQAVQSGDVLFIGSVSGTSVSVVEMALQARAMSVTVIALTSKTFSSALPAAHPSGQRLMDVADVVLDNHAPYGDSFLHLPDLPVPICPLSGVSSACLMWALTALLTQELVARGLQPSVYESVNLPGGMQRYAELRDDYSRNGL